MIRTSYLRVYQPAASFAEGERDAWLVGNHEELSDTSTSYKWLLDRSLPARERELIASEGAFIRHLEDEIMMCPSRTRLRMLAGLLAFRGSIPGEVADAFVPEGQARRAAQELAAISEQVPRVRSHIVHANWHVPLRWFAAFEDQERVLTEDKAGLRIRYETTLEKATDRLQRAVAVLESSWLDEEVTEAVWNVLEWVGGFSEPGLLELDYGSVAGMFTDDALVDDHSAAEVQCCIAALEEEDTARAAHFFEKLTDRWTSVRAREILN